MIWKSLLFLTIITVACAYNADLGLKLCRLTVASYCAPAKVKDWSCRPCNDSPIKLTNAMSFYNSTGDVLGMIGTSSNPAGIFLVFRGTLPWDLKNWMEDINFIKVPYQYCNNACHVHRGFFYAYQEVAAQVLKTVQDYKTRFGLKDVYVTGHSLGGALATHAAVQLVNAGIAVTEFYTYGSPRVGDQKFSVWFDTFLKTNNKNRITHGRDPVPHLPPADFGFTHVPHEIFYHATVKDGFKTCTDSGSKEDGTCSDKYVADVMVTDHLTYYDIDYAGIILACQ